MSLELEVSGLEMKKSASERAPIGDTLPKKALNEKILQLIIANFRHNFAFRNHMTLESHAKTHKSLIVM